MPQNIRAGSGEIMQYLVHEYNDNTIRFVLKYPHLLCAETLCRACRMLIDGNDILHASFQAGTFGAVWHVNDEYEDHCFFQYIRTQGDPVPAALQFSLLPVAPESKTQLRCCLVQSERESAVALNISHLCVDGSDGKYLLEKLMQAYAIAAAGGDQNELQLKQGSRAAEQVYEGLDRHECRSLMKDPRSGIKTLFPYPDEREGLPDLVYTQLSRDMMQSAREKARGFGATVNDLLLAACYHAYGAMPCVDASAPVSIMSMMDLRRHCKNLDSEGLSNLSGSLSTQLPNGLYPTFEETLGDIAAQTAQAKEDPLAGLAGMPLLHGAARTLPLGLLLKVTGKLYGSMAMGFTNLGNIDVHALAADGLVPCDGWFAGPVKKKPAMQVCAASFDGACTLCIAGRFTRQDAQLLQELLENMKRILADFAE
ncbi:MAG: hypothetical protein E7326_05390 [Clostridiales bacterium]|nr:hypothetical protein [Clostridiales bacterium]